MKTIEELAREAGMLVDHAVRLDLRDGTSAVVGSAEIMRAPTDQLAAAHRPPVPRAPAGMGAWRD